MTNNIPSEALNLSLEYDKDPKTMVFRVRQGVAFVIEQELNKSDDQLTILDAVHRALDDGISKKKLPITGKIRDKLLEQFMDGYHDFLAYRKHQRP